MTRRMTTLRNARTERRATGVNVFTVRDDQEKFVAL